MNARRLAAIAAALVFLGAAGLWLADRLLPPAPWSASELALIESLSLTNLPPPPADPSNRVADDPRAAELGHRLFFDTRLSANGAVSCASCHQPERRFADGLPRGVGLGVTARNTPSLVSSAYSPWQYWDGRRDSLWSQALTPLEHPEEHGASRLQILALIAGDPAYRTAYEDLFGAPPDPNDPDSVARAFANVGKAIAAYERLLLPGESRFDRYAAHVAAGGDPLVQDHLSSQELRGLRLFIGDAACIDCHNGPLMTNHEFHNTGLLSGPGELPDRGRVDGVRQVLADPFNCRGAHSDTPVCDELDFVRTGSELIGTTRTPSLRNLGQTAPYQSNGQMPTLADVLEHYNAAPDAMIGHNEAKPLKLSRRDLEALEAFLQSLDAPPATAERWLRAPAADVELH